MTTNDETYNGWTNRETWAFMLYVNNDEGLSDDATGVVYDAVADPACRADALQDWATVMFTRRGYTSDSDAKWPDSLADIAAEIGSLWRINWAECVTALTEDQS